MDTDIKIFIGIGVLIGVIILAFLISSLTMKKEFLEKAADSSKTRKYKFTLWICRILPPVFYMAYILLKILDMQNNPSGNIISVFVSLAYFPYICLTCFFLPALYLVLNNKYSDVKFIIYCYFFGLVTAGIGPVIYYWVKIDGILTTMIRSQSRIRAVAYGFGEDIKEPTYDHSPVSEEERALINHWRAQGLTYISNYVSSPSNPPSLVNLDEAFLLWRNQSTDSRPHANDFLNGLSILFADHLFTKSPCQWVLVDDPPGAKLAVFHNKSGCSLNIRDIFAKRMFETEPWIKSFFVTTMRKLDDKNGNTKHGH